jgi:hypothetical protein
MRASRRSRETRVSAYRRHLAELAYHNLPSSIRGIPVGVVKSFVSREA